MYLCIKIKCLTKIIVPMKKFLRFLCIMAFALMPLWGHSQSPVVDTVPYFCDFEDTVWNHSHWTLINGSCYNFFVIDTSANATPDGSRSLYVTEMYQDALPYSYKPGSSVSGAESDVASRVFAVAVINFPDTGLYDIGFWWNCYGENVYDYGRVILAPTTYVFTASTGQWDTNTSVPGEYLGSVTTPSNCINLNGNSPLSNVTGPQYRYMTFHIGTAGNYQLAVMWLNDGNTGDQPPLMIDDITITPHLCEAPTNLMVDYFTGDTVVMRWDNVAPSYVVKWDTAGVSVSYSHVDTINTNSYMITGLPQNGQYEMLVQAVCPNNSLSMASNYHIVMPDYSCSITELPYTINFDTITVMGDAGTPADIPCWIHLTNFSNLTYAGYPYVSPNSSYAHTGSNVLYYEYAPNYVTRNGWCLPILDRSFDLPGVVVEFWGATTSTEARMVVGVMSDPNNLESLVACDTVIMTGSTPTQYTVPLSNYMGNGRYIAIMMVNPTSTGTYVYAYVDDISLSYEPCMRPGVVSSVITDTSAVITWAPTNGYYYEWTMDLSDDAEINRINDTTLVLSDLSPSTYYTVYLRSMCDAPGMWNAYRFRTPCGPLRSLPYFENFDAYGSGSTTAGTPFIDCWERWVDGIYWYPYIYSYASYAHSGTTSIYWYRNSTAGDYGTTNYVVLPGIDTNYIPMQNVMLKFWAKSSSTSYSPSFEIGVMNSASDTASFRSVGFIDIESTDYMEYSISFENYTDTGSYIAVRSHHTGQSWTAYLDDFTIDNLPTCPNIIIPDELSAGTTSVYLTWENSLSIDSAISYDIEVVDVDSNNAPATYTTNTIGYFVTGLTTNTEYNVRMRASCDTSEGGWAYATFQTRDLPCGSFDSTSLDTAQIGNGTGTDYYIPLNNFYNYSYTQQIVTASELGTTNNTLTGIDFEFSYTTATTSKTNCTIYMAHTNLSDLSSGWIPFDDSFVPVYVGHLNAQSGWNHYEFTNPFTYDGTSNIVISILDNSGAYNGSAYTFYNHNAPNKTRYIYQDGSRYNPQALSGTGTLYSSRSNMKIYSAECLGQGVCAAPNVVVTEVGINDVSIQWAAGNTETSWVLEYKAESDTNWTSLGAVSATSYTFSDLTPSTTYHFRVSAMCGTELYPTTVSSRTFCEFWSIPFFETFQSWTASSSAPAPDCWYKASTYNPNYPYVTTSYNHGEGNRSMYMYNSGFNYTYVVLPRFDAPIDSLEVSFFMLKTNSSYRHSLRVGVMTDPNDISTFQTIQTVSPDRTNQWKGVVVPLDSYHGNGQFIAIRTSPGYNYPYIDDIGVNYIRPCMRPANLSVDNVTRNSVTVYWEDTCTSNFEVEWGPAGFSRGSGTLTTVSADSIDLTGLTVNTQYDIYVRGICGENDTSYWSIPYTFWSGCYIIDSLPFHEDFEGMPSSDSYNPEFVHCWTRLSGDTYIYPYLGGSTSYSHGGGNRGLYWYCTNSSGYNYGSVPARFVVLPEVDTLALPMNTLQLSFWAKPSSSTYRPEFAVGVMTDPNDHTTFTPVDTVVITSTDWTYVDIPMNNYTGHGSFFCLKDIYTSYWYAYVDDFTISEAPDCPSPNRLTTTGNTNTSVDLTWRERGSATMWQVGYSIGDATTMVFDTLVTTTSITIPGLTSGFRYNFAVRSICGSGDTTDWSPSISATPGSWLMRPNMNDTLRTCSAVIYDDGGPDNTYSASQTDYLVIYPEDGRSLIEIEGTWHGESCCDYLGIYDGVGNSGTQFYYGISGSEINLGPFLSSSGPITVYFHSDGSGQYAGYELHVSCVSTTCRVSDIRIDTTYPTSDEMLHVVWEQPEDASYYEVEYGNHGFIPGTGTQMVVYNNHATLAGLTPFTNYDVYVRCFCTTGDTGSWDMQTLQTDMCSNLTLKYSYDSTTMSTTTSSYGPLGYSFYNYGFTQTIVDSAMLAGLVDPINAFAFRPATSSQGDYYTHMDVYLANVPESNLSSGFILPDSNHQYVRVLHDANLCYNNTNWQMHGFDTPFTWDGHSNLLVSVSRRHGVYQSGASFAAHSASSAKTRYVYQDGSIYDPYTPSSLSSGSSGTENLVADLIFYACGVSITCQPPVISNVTHDYETATITWVGSGSDYEVNIKESSAANWPATDIVVSGNSYTFTGLQAATYYTFRVRKHCVEDSMYSIWVEDGILTDSLPCIPPDSLHATAVTNTTATLDWSVNGYETQWDIHVWYSGFDSIYRVTSHPVTIGGFIPGVTYNAAIRPLCGVDLLEGGWSDTVTFTTAVCPNVTGLTAGNITANSITLNWTADPMAQSWVIEYGYYGFDQGTGTQVNTTTNSYVFNGLEDETDYDFYVKAVCGTDWMSENWTNTNATTLSGGVTCEAPVAVHTTVADNSVTVNWTAGEGNNTFELEYGPHGFSHSAGTIVSANASPATISNLDYETQYDVYVRAICDQNTYSAWSTVSTFTTGEQPSEDCDPVANLTVVEITETTATVTWTPGATGDHWQVVVSDANGSTVSDATVSEPRANLTGLTRRTNYTVSVRTDCGEGNHSSYVTANFRTEGEGIDDVTSATCTIYPNPTSNSTTISVSGVNGKVKIAVVDMNGRTVATETLECNSDCDKTMDVDNLAQGAYFVRITSDSVNMVKKLIVR